MPVSRDFPPRLMPAPAAAHYLGVSESMLRTLPIPRRELNRKRVYDKADLDRYADSLPALVPTGTLDGSTARDEIHKASPGPDRAERRSRFFPGLADAMADQWGGWADQQKRMKA